MPSVYALCPGVARRALQRGSVLYRLDKPIAGLQAAHVDRLMLQLQRLVHAGPTVVVVEHDRRVIAACDRVIDMWPGGGEAGGQPHRHPPGTRIAAF